ncbi:MAG: response regulator [Leptospira sp.]|nr:response regulator [Leptospira sp.]
MSDWNEVCLIEDDKIQIFLMQRYLEKTRKFQKISVFENGKSAYNEMERRLKEKLPFPPVVFLDLNMPIWDGWMFYEEFRKLEGSEKSNVFILTSSMSEEDQVRARSLGLGGRYLCKPLSFNDLVSAIEN